MNGVLIVRSWHNLQVGQDRRMPQDCHRGSRGIARGQSRAQGWITPCRYPQLEQILTRR